MPSIDCGLVNPNYRPLLDGIHEWVNKKRTKKLFVNPYEAAYRMVENDFLIPLDNLMYADTFTEGQKNSFLARLNEYTSKVESGKMDNKFATMFWQTSHYGKKDPVVGKILSDAQESHFYFRANELRDKKLSTKLTRAIDRESLKDSLVSRFGLKIAKIKLQKLDDKELKALADVKNGVRGAEDKYNEIKKETNELKSGSHLKVYDDVIDMIEKQIPNAIMSKFQALSKEAFNSDGSIKDKKKAKQIKNYESGDWVLKLTKSDIARYVKTSDGRSIEDVPNIYEAVTTYSELMDGLYKTLRNGVDIRIDSVIERLKINGDARSADEFKEIKKKLRGLYMPKYEPGFFPHYTRDLNVEFLDGLMKSFDDVQTSVNPYDMKSRSVKDIINDLNLHINEHTQKRQQTEGEEGREFSYDYSRNFINSVNNYVFDVNRFNYTAYMDSHLLKALGSIEGIYKKEGSAKGYAKNIADYILDMHKAANGDYNIDPTNKAMMRTFLSFEFISKLGMNPRGAARNFFQRLLDYVEWGPIQVAKTKRYLSEIPFPEGSADNYIDNILNNLGLLYQEATPQLLESQLGTPASQSKKIEYNEDSGKYEAHTKGRMERLADVMGTLASKSSYLHRKAENSNRKSTFKIAYAQMHRWLNNPQFKNKLTERGKESDEEHESIIRKHAENYAINMVVLNHFDYADYSKSPLFRSKIGRFAFQFQHYSMEFFERNMRILREAKYDVKSGNFNPKLLSTEPGGAQGLAKTFRMATLYFGAPAIAAMLWGVDFDNLIEHDSVERIKQWATWLTGDKEEKRQAFYGKGPVLATLGGPFLSDMLEVGMMMELIDADEGDFVSLLTGLERHDPSKRSTDLSRKIRILNTFAGRLVERHIPQLQKGRIGWAVQQELGIYPSSKARKKQKRYKKLRKQILPRDIEMALKEIEGGKNPRSFAKGGQFITKGPETIVVGDNPSGREIVTVEPIPKSKGPAKYNKFDMGNLDMALKELGKIEDDESKIYSAVNNKKLSLGGPDPDDFA